ncbi:hypothetical protein BWQ96_01538 [Gracilariopsis chorda]|uniref:Jacalin-type lectin domain-containing protein n=1 Tax=Gracilariopsis chorda TaxID=448386 RepID=A0A2V3J2L0_9FLOR|nr:hypothetical protein BWQ96_01538 [Gracilariopsis chorda]|eukprot:PXF48686.1 hypothetical protein BWQ96_01538 [Gracilariopsis chorda]
MGFFISDIDTHKDCTSQVLVDGAYPSLDDLFRIRDYALIEVYPCYGTCCNRREDSEILLSPNKLRIAKFNSQTLRFRYEDSRKIITEKCESLQLMAKKGLCFDSLIKCRLSLHRTTKVLQVSLFVGRRAAGTLLFRESLESTTSLRNEGRENGNSSPSSTSWFLGIPNCGLIWGKSTAVGILAITTPSAQAFNDCNRGMPGLIGRHVWPGFDHDDVIRVTEIVLWFSAAAVVGFQAVYNVNNRRRAGPRHRFSRKLNSVTERRFPLRQQETIIGLSARTNIDSRLLTTLRFTTNEDRSFGIELGLPVGSNETFSPFIRIPGHATTFSFYGVLDEGLQNLGLVFKFSV